MVIVYFVQFHFQFLAGKCIVRNKIVEHIITIESALRPHMNSSSDNYLVRSGMKKQFVWGMDIEILTASSLLQTDIYVYTKVGSSYKWQKFSRSMLGEPVPQNKGALYLQNTVIVKKSSPKNLLVDCPSTVSRQLTDRLPTGYRQVKKKDKLW